jgi:hypothetical protein
MKVALIEKITRAARALSIALVGALFVTAPADAASICEKLRSRLNSASETIGNTKEARIYARAIAQQKQQMVKVRSDLRRYGCSTGSIVIFGGRNMQACNTLSNALDRMESNLQALEDHNVSITSSGMSATSRQRLLASLDANGCNDVRPDPTEAEIDTSPTLNASYSREPQATALEPSYDPDRKIRNLGGAGQHGSLQTVCVRTCDGAFFPISSNASTSNFARDAKVCSMMCPGMDTELFYHDLGTQESSDMVSVTGGEPYAAQSFAYKYRNSPAGGTKSCGCDFAAYYREMGKREQGVTTAPQSSRKPAKYSSITSIDTDAEIHKVPEKPAAPVEAKARPYDPSKHPVRQVGPTFLPAEETSSAPSHPIDGEIAQ